MKHLLWTCCIKFNRLLNAFRHLYSSIKLSLPFSLGTSENASWVFLMQRPIVEANPKFLFDFNVWPHWHMTTHPKHNKLLSQLSTIHCFLWGLFFKDIKALVFQVQGQSHQDCSFKHSKQKSYSVCGVSVKAFMSLQAFISHIQTFILSPERDHVAPLPSWPTGGQREPLHKSQLYKNTGRRSSWELTLPGQPQTVNYRGLTWFQRSPGTSNSETDLLAPL